MTLSKTVEIAAATPPILPKISFNEKEKNFQNNS